MEAAGFEPSVLALRHFGEAKLWDRRRTRRLVKTAELLMARPGGRLPQKLTDRADLVGLYRLLDCERVTHASVLGPHRQLTLAAMAAHDGVVLVVHDTTELDFTGVAALANELGQIGNGGCRGYLCHNALAVGLVGGGGRRVLGLANQVLHRRRVVPAGETPARKRAHEGRESRLWLAGCEGVGPAPEGKLWVDVCDRGADAIEFIEYQVSRGRHFVIRAARDRNLDGDDHVGADRIHHKLLSYARDLVMPGTCRRWARGRWRCRRRRAGTPAPAPAPRPCRSAPARCGCGRRASPAGTAPACRWTCGWCASRRWTRRRAPRRWSGC